MIGIFYALRSEENNSFSNRLDSIRVRNDMVHKLRSKKYSCTMIVKAFPIPSHKYFGKYEYVGNIPNIPGLKTTRWPILIPNSCSDSGICMWKISLIDHCDKIGSSAYFVKNIYDNTDVVEKFTSGIGGY